MNDHQNDIFFRIVSSKRYSKTIKKVFLLCCVLVSHLVSGQDSTQTNYSFNGYLTEMASGMTESVTKEWIIDNQLYNRLNFKWFNDANTFTATFELRNRFMLRC